MPAERTQRNRQKREKHRKKKYAQQKHQQRYTPPQPPRKFEIPYGPDFLRAFGPLLFASWSVPRAVRDALGAAARPVPQEVNGVLLLDTGASGTCISMKAATALGLHPTRLQAGYGAGGLHQNPVFLANLEIRITDPKTLMTSAFGWEQEVQGIPDLEKCVPALQLQGHSVEVVGLLGRDILRHSRIHYDGPNGNLRFEFDVSSLGLTPSLQTTP